MAPVLVATADHDARWFDRLVVVGLIAGWLAGMVMKGGGYGILGDIIVGLIGSVVGGFLVSFFVTATPASGAASSWPSSAPAS